MTLAVLFLLLAADPWLSAPFPDWSERTVVRLVTDSPWARPRNVRLEWVKRNFDRVDIRDIPGTQGPGPTIQGGSPVGGIGVPKRSLPDEAQLFIRWSSALPIRQAKALYRARDEKLDAARTNELVGVPDSEYVLEIHGAPVQAAHLGTVAVELAANSGVTLTTSSGRTLRPTGAHARISADTLVIEVRFSKEKPLTLADKEIEVSADLQVFRFKERFKLKDMTYLGHLEM